MTDEKERRTGQWNCHFASAHIVNYQWECLSPPPLLHSLENNTFHGRKSNTTCSNRANLQIGVLARRNVYRRWLVYLLPCDNNCNGIIPICQVVRFLVGLWRRNEEDMEFYRKNSSSSVWQHSHSKTLRLLRAATVTSVCHCCTMCRSPSFIPVRSTLGFRSITSGIYLLVMRK